MLTGGNRGLSKIAYTPDNAPTPPPQWWPGQASTLLAQTAIRPRGPQRPHGPAWRLCDAQPPLRLEGCWRVHFSPWDRAARSGAVYPAPGPRDGRIVADVVMQEGSPALRVLAVGPKYAGRGQGRQEWVYRHADRRRRHTYENPKGGGST